MPAETKTDRPQIAAMYRGKFTHRNSVRLNHSVAAGPGPARYSLPGMTGNNNHDCRRKVHPAYSFGLRLGTSCK